MRNTRWNERQLALFSRQLGQLLSVGFGLLQALTTIRRYGSRRVKKDIDAALLQLQEGESLSDCLEKIRFPPFYRFLMTAAEHHGRYAETLALLADYYERRDAQKYKRRKALLYPSFVFCSCVVAYLLIVYGLLPQLAGLYDSFALELPWQAAYLLRLSTWNELFWTMIFSCLFFSLFLFYFFKKRRFTCEKWLLRVPFLSLLIKTRLTAITLRQIGYLLDSGIRATRVCDLFATKEQWQIVSQSFQQMKRDLLQGASFSEAFERLSFLHPLAAEAAFVFEQSGTLAAGLTELATQFETEYDRKLEMFSTYFETGAVVVAGAFVFLMILVLFLPIFQFIQYV